jgi:nitrate reductase NapD
MRLNRFVEAAQAPMTAPTHDWNVCGVLVHVRQDRRGQVSAALAALPGVEIHASDSRGPLIATIEDVEDKAGRHWAGATLTRFYDVPGVITAALVYHQSVSQPSSSAE